MQAFELLLHRMDRLGQAGDFRRHLVGADGVMGNFERGVRDELRAADGDAARHADAVQDKAHWRGTGLKGRDMALARTMALLHPALDRRPLYFTCAPAYALGSRSRVSQERREASPSSANANTRSLIRCFLALVPSGRSIVCKRMSRELLQFVTAPRRNNRRSAPRSRPSPLSRPDRRFQA